jgi:deferrochelatase/peroxidase EfeB
MNDAQSPSANLNLNDIQGVILRGFRSYKYIRHLLFTITDVDGARKLCNLLVPGSKAPMTVTLAAPWGKERKPPYCLNIGVSNHGLRKLAGDDFYDQLVNNSNPLFGSFDTGADNQTTAATVNDVGASAPANWWKSGGWQPPAETPSNGVLDVLMTVYAPAADARAQWASTLLSMIPAGKDGTPSVQVKFIRDCDPLEPADSIHFGYVDGISQPRVAGAPSGVPPGQPDDRPIVPSYRFIIDHTQQAVDPFLDNGCFGAFRLLYQDVGEFEAFVAQAAAESGQSADVITSKMCGRWKDGTPVEVSPEQADPSITGSARVNYKFLSHTPNQQKAPAGPDFDTYAQRCPYASHTRRTNPRDDWHVTKNDDNAEIHRVMRRAFAYGPAYAEDPTAQRGLAGLFMGASLTDQFEFLMGTWIFGNAFRFPDLSLNASGIDPLFGTTVVPNSNFDYLPSNAQLPPTSSDYISTTGLKRFIRTDGGLYVFLPGIAALALLGKGPIPAAA